MNQKLLFRLRRWRDSEATRAGMPSYRVLPNATLEALAEALPLTRAEMLAIPGIKDAKWTRYGAALLAMVGDALEAQQYENSSEAISPNLSALSQQESDDELQEKNGVMSSVGVEEIMAVGAFLDILNESLCGIRVALRGEVSGVEERRGIVYFSLRDDKDGSMISCIVFRSVRNIFDVPLEEGVEVIVEGSPNIWKPRGKLSFQVSVIRLAGEGALRKQYEALCQKLAVEGIFDEGRKREIPKFPKRIALITSREGAAIGDFLKNIGQFGFQIALLDTHVEGSRALPELLKAIRFFNTTPDTWDVLVVMRGGGSLESLEAFNAEAFVRAVAESDIPVLAGIGHEKDVSLAALAADRMVSTPTAAAEFLSRNFQEASMRLEGMWHETVRRFASLIERSYSIQHTSEAIVRHVFQSYIFRFYRIEECARKSVQHFSFFLNQYIQHEVRVWQALGVSFEGQQERLRHQFALLVTRVGAADPLRPLWQGYSILSKDHHVVKHVADLTSGDSFHFRMSDGEGEAIVSRIDQITKKL